MLKPYNIGLCNQIMSPYWVQGDATRASKLWLCTFKKSSALFFQEKQLLSHNPPSVVNGQILAWFDNFDWWCLHQMGVVMALEFMEYSGSVSSCSDVYTSDLMCMWRYSSH